MALLVKRLDVNVGDVPNVIVACCTLHNICDNFDERLKDVETTRGSVGVWSKINVHRALMTHFQ